jgi:hypothetical protein
MLLLLITVSVMTPFLTSLLITSTSRSGCLLSSEMFMSLWWTSIKSGSNNIILWNWKIILLLTKSIKIAYQWLTLLTINSFTLFVNKWGIWKNKLQTSCIIVVINTFTTFLPRFSTPNVLIPFCFIFMSFSAVSFKALLVFSSF